MKTFKTKRVSWNTQENDFICGIAYKNLNTDKPYAIGYKELECFRDVFKVKRIWSSINMRYREALRAFRNVAKDEENNTIQIWRQKWKHLE